MDLDSRKKVFFFLNEKVKIMQQQALACGKYDLSKNNRQAKACRCKVDNISQQQASVCGKCNGKSSLVCCSFEVLAINVLPDHVHIIIKTDEEDVSEIIRNLKGYSSFMLSRYLKLSEKGEGRQVKIWAKHFSKTFIRDEKHLNSSIEYVLNNHLKHEVDSIF